MFKLTNNTYTPIDLDYIWLKQKNKYYFNKINKKENKKNNKFKDNIIKFLLNFKNYLIKKLELNIQKYYNDNIKSQYSIKKLLKSNLTLFKENIIINLENILKIKTIVKNKIKTKQNNNNFNNNKNKYIEKIKRIFNNIINLLNFYIYI